MIRNRSQSLSIYNSTKQEYLNELTKHSYDDIDINLPVKNIFSTMYECKFFYCYHFQSFWLQEV